jgi:hypothetical protein
MTERRAEDPLPQAERRAAAADQLAALEGVRQEVAGLRDDVREDARELRAELRASLEAFALAHGREHQAESAHLSGLVDDAARDHARFDAFIRNAELAQARRDGTLGVFRFVVELLGRYYRPIGALIMTLGMIVAAATGALTISIGIR